MYLLQITFAANACHKPPKALITVTKTGLLQSGQCTGVHGHGAGCKLHGPTYQIFVWRGSKLESFELRESRRPLAEGVPCPPPTEKNQDTNFPAVRGVSRFSCRDTVRNRSGSVSRKFWVAPLAKNQDTILPAVRGVSRFFFSRRAPIFLFRTPSETAAGACPENFG